MAENESGNGEMPKEGIYAGFGTPKRQARFVPKTDITAFELAQIVTLFQIGMAVRLDFVPVEMVDACYDLLGPEVTRHFQTTKGPHIFIPGRG